MSSRNAGLKSKKKNWATVVRVTHCFMAGDLLEESSVQAVVVPNIQEPAPAQVLPQQQTQTQPGTTPSTTPPSAATPSTSVEMQPLPGSSSQLGKRSRDDGDT